MIVLTFLFLGAPEPATSQESEAEEPIGKPVPTERAPRRSTRKKSEPADHRKKAPQWATTLTIGGMQYVLKDLSGVPVCGFSSFTSVTDSWALQISGAKSLPMGPNDGVRFNIGLPELAPIHNFPKEIPEPILITEAEAQQKLLEMGVSAPFLRSLTICLLIFPF